MKEMSAFIFDLDGVITDTAEYHYLAWKGLADELGIAFDRDFNENLKGISRLESLERMLAHGGLSGRFSGEQKRQWTEQKNEHYQRLIADITPREILPGIVTLLTELKQHGIKIGLASASKNALAVLGSLELTASFDIVVDAGKIQRGKPDPEIFLTAAEQLGVQPRSCIGVEDAASGVEAIRAADMFAVGVGDAKVLKRADMVVSSTAQLTLRDIADAFQHRSG